MRFPLRREDIFELSIEECEVNAILETFEELFNEEFTSIEFYGKNHNENTEYVRKKIFYSESGFINRIELYKPSSEEPTEITHYEKSEFEIISKKQIQYGFQKEVWKFNHIRNLISFQSAYGGNYLFEYDEDGNLESISEGFNFKWQNNGISELIRASDDTILKKITRTELETIVEFVGRKNDSVSGITTYKYDEFGRLVRIESSAERRLTEIKYEIKNGLKSKFSTSFFDQEQISFSSVIEKQLTKNKIEVELQFQQRKSSPIMKSKVVKIKREKPKK